MVTHSRTIVLDMYRLQERKHVSDVTLLVSSFLVFLISSSFYLLFQMGANHRII